MGDTPVLPDSTVHPKRFTTVGSELLQSPQVAWQRAPCTGAHSEPMPEPDGVGMPPADAKRVTNHCTVRHANGEARTLLQGLLFSSQPAMVEPRPM